MPLKTAKLQHGFKKGVSGNPAGRPRGSRNKTTLAVEDLLDGEAERLTRKAIKLALAGDMTALKLCLERIAPPRRDFTVRLSLPALDSASDISEATAVVIAAVASGELGLSAAESVLRLLDGHRRALDSSEIEQRVFALEQAIVESR